MAKYYLNAIEQNRMTRALMTVTHNYSTYIYI